MTDPLRTASVTMLGSPLAHQLSLQAMLAAHVGRLDVVSESFSFVRDHLDSTRARLLRRRDELTRTRDHDYLEMLTAHLDTAGTEAVVAYWGTLPIPDLIALRRLRPGVRQVLVVLCHPVSTSTIGVARQQIRMRQAAAVADAFVLPTHAMQRWFADTIVGRRRAATAVVPPCWPADHVPAVQPPPAAADANVIFLGRTDATGATAVSADDARPVLRALLDAGIEVHHGSNPMVDDGHRLRRPFPPSTLRDLIPRVAAHDASVVAYATGGARRLERFALSVPDRLITSAIAGVPIAVPSDGYGGTIEYLSDHPSVLRYDDARHLARMLGDRGRVNELRDAAWQARTGFVAERHAAAMCEVVRSLL